MLVMGQYESLYVQGPGILTAYLKQDAWVVAGDW